MQNPSLILASVVAVLGYMSIALITLCLLPIIGFIKLASTQSIFLVGFSLGVIALSSALNSSAPIALFQAVCFVAGCSELLNP